MDSVVTTVHSKGRDAEVVVPGFVLKVSEAVNKLEDLLAEGTMRVKAWEWGYALPLESEHLHCWASQLHFLRAQCPHLLSGRK